MGFKKGGNVLLMDVDIGELLLELFGEVWIDFYRMKLVFVLDAAGDVFGEGARAWAELKDRLTKVAFAEDGLGKPRELGRMLPVMSGVARKRLKKARLDIGLECSGFVGIGELTKNPVLDRVF